VNTDGVVQKPGQSSGSEDEQRKWKIVIKHVALIDLEAVIKFCKADNGSAKVEEACLTGKLPMVLPTMLKLMAQRLWRQMSYFEMFLLRSTLKSVQLGTDSFRPKAQYRSPMGRWSVKASCSKCFRCL